MKVLLQDKQTRLFFKEPASWTNNVEDAFVFINSERAIELACERQFPNVHLVLWFQEQNYSLTVPFQKAREHANRRMSHAKPDKRVGA